MPCSGNALCRRGGGGCLVQATPCAGERGDDGDDDDDGDEDDVASVASVIAIRYRGCLVQATPCAGERGDGNYFFSASEHARVCRSVAFAA